MTRVKVTYIAVDDYRPIVSAGTFEDLRKGLDEHYGVETGHAECLGFTPYVSKYPDEYEGHYTYEGNTTVRDQVEKFIDEIRVYCISYYPYTVYEVNE